MTLGTKIITDNRLISDGEYKKYRSDQEQLQQNQREKEVQKQRDELARQQATNGNGSSPNRQ
jgi:hypothetical protein